MAEQAHTPTLSRRHFLCRAATFTAALAAVPVALSAQNDPAALVATLRRFGVTISLARQDLNYFIYTEDNCNDRCFARASMSGAIRGIEDNRAGVADYLRSPRSIGA